MSVNLELHYLLGETYEDSQGVLSSYKKAVLSQATTIALQSYSETEHWSGHRRGGFTNEGTYTLHTEAEVCEWWDCFSRTELETIKSFCISHGYDDALKEIPQK